MAAAAHSRRLRHDRPDPRVRRLVLGEADYALFRAIERHGPLPSRYLYEFTRHLREDWTHLQNRLTEFYNGDVGGSLLMRPPQQFASFNARYQHLVYDLTPRARMLLAERQTSLAPAIRRTDPFIHRLMSACVGASFALTAPLHALRYIGFDEILSRPGAIRASKASNPFALPIGLAGQSAIVPDILFGLKYPGSGFRFFAVECDRNTESIERRNLGQSAFSKKLLAYNAALRAQTYRTWWGIPNLHVLTITTSELHARNMIGAIAKHVEPDHQSAFALSVEPLFGAHWRVPRTALTLLGKPWQSVTGTRDFSKP